MVLEEERTRVNSAADKTWLIGPRGPEYERTGAGAAVWNLYDGLGSVTGTVDSSGNIVSARKYDVYGSVRQLTGPSGTQHKFCGGLGHPSEDATGLVYMRARYMDPAQGRFVSEDPKREGANWFQYALARPVQVVDPDGRGIVDDVVRAFQALLSGGAEALGWVPGGPGNAAIALGIIFLSVVILQLYNVVQYLRFAGAFAVIACETGMHPMMCGAVWAAMGVMIAAAGQELAWAAVSVLVGRQLIITGQILNDEWQLEHSA